MTKNLNTIGCNFLDFYQWPHIVYFDDKKEVGQCRLQQNAQLDGVGKREEKRNVVVQLVQSI